jgi:putative alpha-1,2-mannosidase
MHAAVLKITFPTTGDYNDKDKSICFTSAQFSAVGNTKLTGRATQVHHDRMPIVNFALYIHIESSAATGVHQDNDMMCFQYNKNTDVVIVRMATSLISAAQAEQNYKSEVGGREYEQVYALAKKTWHE